MVKRYEIRAAVSHVSVKLGAWTLYSFPFRIGHHFFLLVEIDDAGQEHIIEAIHGLATQYSLDKTGEKKDCIASPLGTWNSQLKAYCIAYPGNKENTLTESSLSEWEMPYNKDYWIEPRETYPIYGQGANQNDALVFWNKAKECIRTLNQYHLSYSFCGFGKSLGLNCRNSNSVYATIAKHIGLKTHRFEGYRAPGLDTTLLPQKMKYSISFICSNDSYRVLSAFK